MSDLLLPVVIAGSAVSLISGTLLALFLPQKIAGPLYRVELGLKAVEQGDFSVRVVVRKNDTLRDFAGRVDETIVTLRNRVQELKTIHNSLEKAVAEGQQENIHKALTEQRAKLEQIKL